MEYRKRHYRRFNLLSVVLGFFLSIPLLAQIPTCGTECPNEKIQPFRIIGNIYWIGLSDHGSLLLTSPQGHIMIDTGAEENGHWIRENIEELGFELRDVKYVLGSHTHADHVGGFSLFKELTGVKLVISAADAPVLSSGGHADYRGGTEFFTPVNPDITVEDGETIQLGSLIVTAHITPGHTRGCTTWTTTVEEEGRTLNVVIPCELAVAGERAPLINNLKYPGIADDYRKAFAIVRGLPCDVFLTLRSGTFRRIEKQKRLERGERPNPFIDPKGLQVFVDAYEKRFLEQFADEQSRM